MIKKEEKNNAK